MSVFIYFSDSLNKWPWWCITLCNVVSSELRDTISIKLASVALASSNLGRFLRVCAFASILRLKNPNNVRKFTSLIVVV